MLVAGARGALGLCCAVHARTRHATRTGRDHILGCCQSSAARAAIAQAHNPEAHASGLAVGMAESEKIYRSRATMWMDVEQASCMPAPPLELRPRGAPRARCPLTTPEDRR